jgi:hypothetical protein
MSIYIRHELLKKLVNGGGKCVTNTTFIQKN